MVVGHSAASTLAWLAADARPQRVAKVAFIGGFPNADGESYADFFPVVDGAMPFPGWEPFEGADSADLDQEMKARIADAAIPVPDGVSKGCRAADRRAPLRRPGGPGVPGVHAGRGASSGSTPARLPELAKAKRLEMVDIATGHWPMVSAPAELARGSRRCCLKPLALTVVSLAWLAPLAASYEQKSSATQTRRRSEPVSSRIGESRVRKPVRTAHQ